MMALAAKLDERVQLGWSRPGEQPVPRIRADARHQRQPGRRRPEPDGPLETARSASTPRTLSSAPGSIVATRKMVAAVSGVSTACGSCTRTGSSGCGVAISGSRSRRRG